MAKFCGNCGSQIEDDARVCGYCGVVQDEDPGKVNIPGITDALGDENVNKIKGIAKKVIPAVVAVVVLIVGISIASNFIGYKGAIRNFIKAYEKLDADKITAMYSDVYYQRFDDFEADLSEHMYDYFTDEVEEELGTELKIDYEIVKADKVSENKFNKILDELEEDDDVSTDNIKAIRSVKVKAEIKGPEKRSPQKHTFEFYLFKEGGEWKIYPDNGRYNFYTIGL